MRAGELKWRGFDNRREAEEYARESGLPLGRRVKDRRLRDQLSPYFVGRFSPYHYETITPKEKS